MRTASGRTTNATAAPGADNAADFSGQKGKIGLVPAGWSTTLTAAQLAARKFRIYRGGVVSLQSGEIDPLTMLEADWLRTVARGVFS